MANSAVLLFLAIDFAVSGIIVYALAVYSKSEGGLKKSRLWGIRTKATMANEEVFAYANRLAVKTYMITSAASFIIAAFMFVLGIVSIFVETYTVIWVIAGVVVGVYTISVLALAIAQSVTSHRAAKRFMANSDAKGEVNDQKGSTEL